MGARVYTIDAGIAFVDALARGLCNQAGGDPLALATMTVLLPTRRAVRALTEAFLRVRDGEALLLPRMLALADLEGDEDAADAGEIAPALDPLERQLILARLVMSRPGVFAVTPDQALRLAASLAELIDEVETEQVDFARLQDLAPEEFAGHWQATVEFLQIVTAHWPAILEQRGAIDPARRRVLALARRAARWRDRPPADPVIAAGFITADPALAALIATVARLPAGAVVLPGLDRGLDNAAWDAVEPAHPQWGLKRLLDAVGVGRADVLTWPAVDHAESAALASRVRLLSEAMRPAETTEAWRSGPPIAANALNGIVRVDCATIGEEAEVIALAMRHALETPGRTAALVTADRGLARRVAAALTRWGIEVDDSAGRPLSETPVGVWLRLIAEAVATGFAPRPLLAMLKHPLAAGGLPREELRRRVRILERAVLRGPRPAPGLAPMAGALARIPATAFTGGQAGKNAIIDWLDDLTERLGPFVAAMATGGSLADLAARHAEAAEALAETPDEAGALNLWRREDGEAAADLFARLDSMGGDWPPHLAGERYAAVIGELMATVVVRPLYGAHPRLAIWGLIEARLQRADLMILGGLNEGGWPPRPGEEPWMSRKMRGDFGLMPFEARVGLTAQDFALAASAPEILLMRAERVDGAPTVPARWLSRLEVVLKSCGLALPAEPGRVWRGWAEALDDPGAFAPWPRPEPRPPLPARPRGLSVTAVELWMRDPYALYAKHILRLRALDPLDADPGAAERGEFVHLALDRFVRAFPAAMPPDAVDRLLAEGRAAFGEALGHPSVAAFWWPRFERIARWFVDFELDRRRDGSRTLATEIEGGIDVEAGDGIFRLTAKADRIDRLADGRLAVIDYKTGRPPRAGDVLGGQAPQLPLEAIIAEHGGFQGVAMGEVGELAFLQLGGGNPPGAWVPAVGNAPLEAAIQDAWAGLVGLIESFADPATGYHARPRPELAYPGDYDHLARIEEWSAS
jgi:ATP-dependent helicase/nuclease subunit B